MNPGLPWPHSNSAASVPPATSHSIEPFSWRSIGELSELVNRLGPHGFRIWPSTATELRDELEMVRLDPESDIALLKVDGQACGYVLVIPEADIDRAVVSIGIVSDHRQHMESLVEFAAGRATAAGLRKVHLGTRVDASEWQDQLAELGFSSVASNLDLVLQRHDLAELTEPELPSGYAFRQMKSQAETLLLTRLQNRVFEEHWGFSRNTPEEVGARLAQPGTGPEHVLLLESPEGEVVGYVWTTFEWANDRTTGKISMTGLTPGVRGSGLGRSLIVAGVKHLLANGASEIALEVIAENEAARRIYEVIGFREVGRIYWYEKRVGLLF